MSDGEQTSAHTETQGQIRSSEAMLNDITTLLEEDGGQFVMAFDEERGWWNVALVWGREAEDSPMAGAAAYGSDKVAAAAVEAALREAGR